MTIDNLLRYLATSALSLCLAACGGGGGGGGGMGSTPPPAPAPTPTPAPAPFFPKVFPAVTASTDFAALGYESYTGVGGEAPHQLRDGIAVRYDASAQAYIIDLPSAPPGRFQATSEDSSQWRGYLLDQPMVSPSVDIRKPIDGFTYTTLGDYFQYEWAPVDFFNGVFAFGQATPSGGVPTSGAATYSALLAGKAVDSGWDIGGTATLSFNFASGTLAGSLSPILMAGSNTTALGQYDFVNTIYSVGGTTFSGGLKHSTNGLLGSFNGQFTGPQAQELMARWLAQYADPASGQPKEMFGVLIGKRP